MRAFGVEPNAIAVRDDDADFDEPRVGAKDRRSLLARLQQRRCHDGEARREARGAPA